ncbi:MAG: hypothetical protein WCL06_06585 [Bacteroidota bacterium]
MMKKMIIAWVLAVIITLSAAYYQRVTGPTYPKKITTNIRGIAYNFTLLRTHSSESDCEISLPIDDNSVRGFMIFRKYYSKENGNSAQNKWDTLSMKRVGDHMTAYLPKLPPAGKLEYYFLFRTGDHEYPVAQDKPVVIRYKGDVPPYVLIPHILFIFLAMLLSNLVGILGAFKVEKARMYMFITFGLLLIGGMILGPFVQKFAFGEFWTGVPFGWDLTDNKTLIAFAAWVIALAANLKKFRPGYLIAAAIVTLAIFSIPHSMFGSELNHTTGTVTTG